MHLQIPYIALVSNAYAVVVDHIQSNAVGRSVILVTSVTFLVVTIATECVAQGGPQIRGDQQIRGTIPN